MTPPPDSFRPAQKWLHWLTASCIILQYAMFDGIGRLFGQGVESGAMPYTFVTIGHIVLGTTVLVFALLRLTLRWRHGVPPHPAAEPAIATLAAKVAHCGLYVLIIGLPVLGLLAWFLPSERLAELHATGTTLLIWLVIAHVAAVVVHQVWWRTDILRRMT
ncbi:cytochrome b [Paracoccus sp. 22332]|uniref:cytochrome b n=1 Tax=Paracoccus sp. 22332 TaxID=3453913 RepID=UPI003F870B0E